MHSAWARRLIATAFDRWATTYEEDVTPKLRHRGYSYQALAAQIVTMLDPSSDSAILELGTGSGVLGEEIAKLTKAHLVGADISMQMLRLAQRTARYALLCHCTAESLPFADASFSGLYSAFMCHSVLAQDAAFGEMHRIVKPGGIVAIIDLCPHPSRVPGWTLIRGNVHSLRYEHGALSNYATVSQYVERLERADFTVQSIVQLGEQRDYTHVLFECLRGK